MCAHTYDSISFYSFPWFFPALSFVVHKRPCVWKPLLTGATNQVVSPILHRLGLSWGFSWGVLPYLKASVFKPFSSPLLSGNSYLTLLPWSGCCPSGFPRLEEISPTCKEEHECGHKEGETETVSSWEMRQDKRVIATEGNKRKVYQPMFENMRVPEQNS